MSEQPEQEVRAEIKEYFTIGGQDRRTDAIPRVSVGVLARLEEKYDVMPDEIEKKAGFRYQLDLLTWTLQEKWPEITAEQVAAIDSDTFLQLVRAVNAKEISDPLG